MRRSFVVLGIALVSAGCMQAWQPRRYLAQDARDACGAWDLECSTAAHGTYGCGPSGCGTPASRIAK